MAQLEVTFYDGTGKAYINPNAGEEDGTAAVTADCNCGDDRTVNVRVASDKGGLSKQVTINQVGVREQFIPADQTEGMKGADGDYFLGIKAEYADNLPDGCIPPPEHIHIDQTQTDPAKMITGDVRGKTITAIKEGSNCFVNNPPEPSFCLSGANIHINIEKEKRS